MRRLDDDELEDDEDDFLDDGQARTANGAERNEEFLKVGLFHILCLWLYNAVCNILALVVDVPCR